MRQERIIQATIFEVFAEHEIGRELKAISQWLDEHRGLLGLAANDLRRRGIRETGRHGLPAQAVVRCALLKQYRQLSYQELAFHLEDSASFRAFARLPLSWSPSKSVLHKTISAISAASWETINRSVASSARHGKLESGAMIRIDSTVTQALMHAAHRQLSAVGCGARDGASAEAGERPAWRAVDHLAQSSPAGQEARPGHPMRWSKAAGYTAS